METLIPQLQAWLAQMGETHAWVQLIVFAASALMAYAVNGQWNRLVAGQPEEGLRHLARRSAQRLVFPITTLAGVLVGRAILQSLDMPVGILNIAIPLMTSLAGIRLAVYVLRKGFAPSAALKAWEGIVSTGAWTLVALHLTGWLPDVLEAMDALAFQLGSARISLLSVSKLLLLLGALLALALWGAGLVERQLRKAEHISAGVQVGLAKVLRFVLVTLALLLGLNAVGIDLTALAVFGGALGVGLGFGLQRIASNFISGFLLVLDRSIRPGDVISVGKTFGWVQELRARYVVIRNRDGVDTLIPNESLITSEVVNWSYSDRKVRVRVPVQISYDDDPEVAMELVTQAAKASPRVLPDPKPSCRLTGFGDNGIGLELRVWVNDPENGVGSVRSAINMAIWKTFKQHGITMPYPHQELYVKEWPGAGSLQAPQDGLKAG